MEADAGGGFAAASRRRRSADEGGFAASVVPPTARQLPRGRRRQRQPAGPARGARPLGRDLAAPAEGRPVRVDANVTPAAPAARLSLSCACASASAGGRRARCAWSRSRMRASSSTPLERPGARGADATGGGLWRRASSSGGIRSSPASPRLRHCEGWLVSVRRACVGRRAGWSPRKSSAPATKDAGPNVMRLYAAFRSGWPATTRRPAHDGPGQAPEGWRNLGRASARSS